ISDADLRAIVDGLRRVEQQLAAGELAWDEALEDVHMNVEARLIDQIGDAGRRLHTARSRNDQVATDLRLYTVDAAEQLIDAVGDRDFAIELVGACAVVQLHLSRLGEELVLWSSQEFGFARIGEAYCSGSSLMPQKVNPDLAELVRGKAGRVVGDWVALATV